ncbi:oligopeptide ABC transporter substrate-binding protein [Weissella viridescens]|uniref:Oligopeptide ABC transporter substrate-binding protein n=1 Tax=Weissella viridescens TaxID=1629 RepID=A0A3P2RFB1_WEIVI|nr:oligopeptide ABC transporter substrate-binding protein [Weissella viridescens]
MSKGKWIAGVTVAAVVLGGGGYLYYASQHNDNATGGKVGNLNVEYKNDKSVKKGGNLNVAYESDVPFKAQFEAGLMDDATMQQMAAPATGGSVNGGGGIFNADNNFNIQKGGAADISFDKSAKTATVTLRDNLKWSDGKPVTAKDYEFAYEIVANPAYGSSRWTDSLANIEGLSEYHEGKAKSISGITFPDGEGGKTIKIQFKENKPGFKHTGNGYFLESVSPYHYLKDVEPKSLASDPKTTTKPLVIGPFKPEKIVSGESIYYTQNKYYYGKKPNLKSITYTTVDPSKTVASVKAGKYDVVKEASPSVYPQIKKLSNVAVTGQQQLYISMLNFNLGHYDTKKSENVQDRKTPLQDKRVRQAIGYARNVDEVDKKFGNGLQTRANTLIPPIFKDYSDTKLKGYPEDIKKANKLLDEAGWKWDKKHEYREKDGKRLNLTYMARQSNGNSEAIAKNYIQQWKKIGANVTLYKGRLTDFNTYLQITTSPESGAWDLTDAAWSLSSDPSQNDLFSKGAQYNTGHFTSPELTKKLNKIDSSSIKNDKQRAKAFKDYQKYMNDEAYVIPTSFQTDYTPVNKRVANWSMAYGDNNAWSDLGVTSNSPSKN